MKKIFQQRQTQGDYNNLVLELRNEDENFSQYMRMSVKFEYRPLPSSAQAAAGPLLLNCVGMNLFSNSRKRAGSTKHARNKPMRFEITCSQQYRNKPR